ncbi:uncharacterized protein KQ657_001025 [Scheffersomyces spartinae]|uniref:Uncharacterized protein n=1 Tax=Scheffersomyces spartinae TaxID=45513 RepID=A0A9P7V8N7_9ASCO|nr:uncharacterized protein KQ657_001025 [Scheffersomyces spartinae]KAG7193262.1 hypothetical protein KQ657_001025 [Scheffersomyces spartinae]
MGTPDHHKSFTSLSSSTQRGASLGSHPHGLHSKHISRHGEPHSAAEIGSVTPLQGSTIFNSKSATVSRNKVVGGTKLDIEDFKHPQMSKSSCSSTRSSPLEKYRKKRNGDPAAPNTEPSVKRLLSLKTKIPKMSPPNHEDLDFDGLSSPTNRQGTIPDPIDFDPSLREEDVTRTNVMEYTDRDLTKAAYLNEPDKENITVDYGKGQSRDTNDQSHEIQYDKEVRLAASKTIEIEEPEISNGIKNNSSGGGEQDDMVLSPITKDVYDFESPISEVKAPSVDRSEEFMTALENKVSNDQKLKETISILQEQVAYDVGISKHLLDNFQFMTDYYSIQMKGKSDTISRLEQSAITLQEQMDEKDLYIEKLVETKVQMQDTIDSKNEQISQLLSGEEKLLEKNTHAYSELSIKSEKIADLEAEVSKLENEIDTVKSALHEKEVELVDAIKRVDFLHQQNAEFSNDAKTVENLRREVDALESNNKRIEHFLHSEYSKKLAQRIQAREATWNEKVSSLQTKYERSQLEVKRLMQMVSGTKSKQL